MTKDVIISILSSQDHLEGGPDEIRLMSTGTMTVTDRGYHHGDPHRRGTGDADADGRGLLPDGI